MYAKICDLEMLSSYITDVVVGDILVVQALVANPLDWHHFYEKISTIKKGDRTDFTIVTKEGERLVGSGLVQDLEKWNNNGKFAFKIKITIKKQKSLSDRRLRIHRSNWQKSIRQTDLLAVPVNQAVQ
jgi:hypothetical protein